MKKLLRRFVILLKSVPNIILGCLFEFNKQPWRVIFDTIILSSAKLQLNSLSYIKRYFETAEVRNGLLISIGDFKILIPTKYKNNSHYLYTMLVLYFDIYYPNNVRFPIPALINEGSYDQAGVSTSSGDVIIDVGSNIGFYSLVNISKSKPAGKIFAFEPIEYMCNIISDSLEYNPGHNIEIVKKALGADDSDIFLNFSEENFGGASAYIEGDTVKLEQTKLDTFVKNYSLEKVSLIKMDIEGMEPAALLGASETIKLHKPKLAICTYHKPEHPKEIEEIILSLRPDYKIYHSSHKIFAW